MRISNVRSKTRNCVINMIMCLFSTKCLINRSLVSRHPLNIMLGALAYALCLRNARDAVLGSSSAKANFVQKSMCGMPAYGHAYGVCAARMCITTCVHLYAQIQIYTYTFFIRGFFVYGYTTMYYVWLVSQETDLKCAFAIKAFLTELVSPPVAGIERWRR